MARDIRAEVRAQRRVVDALEAEHKRALAELGELVREARDYGIAAEQNKQDSGFGHARFYQVLSGPGVRS